MRIRFARGAGVLVAVEGIDGAGKSTLARRLEERLGADGFDVLATREPTDGPWGRKLRASMAEGRLSPEEELRAFVEDRREHVALELAPALEAGRVVIVDRYYFSTAAYQGARGLDPEAILRENEAFAPPPDLLVVVELDPAVGLERIRARGDRANHFEREADLRRCAAIFAAIERPYLRRVDGRRPPEELADELRAALLAGPIAERAQSGRLDEPALTHVRGLLDARQGDDARR